MVCLIDAKWFRKNACPKCDCFGECKKNIDSVRRCADHVHEENLGFTYEELLNAGSFDDNYHFGAVDNEGKAVFDKKAD